MSKPFEILKNRWKSARSSGSLVEILVSRCLASATARDTLDANQTKQPYGVVTPTELMKVFTVSGMDYEGQTTTGYIAAGFDAEVKGSLVPIPGISLGPNFGAKAQRLKNNLLLLQRLPAEIRPDEKSKIVASGSLPPIRQNTAKVSRKHVYLNRRKIQLLLLTGAWWEVEVTIGVAAGIGFGSGSPQQNDRRNEARALGLGISLTANADIKAEGQLMQLDAYGLSEYKTLFDDNLIKIFGRILTKVEEKKMVEHALRFVNSKFNRDLREHDNVWRTPIKPGERTPPTKGSGYGYSIEDALIIITLAITKATTEDRRTWVEPTPEEIAQDDSRKKFLAQLNNYKDVLRKEPDFAKIKVDGKSPRNNFLRLWGYGGKGDLSFKAGVIGLVDASAAAEGRLAATNFRLQTQTQQMIQTQETEIQYRQMTFTAKVSGTALKTLEVAANKLAGTKAKSKSGETRFYNMLVYRSAFVRWKNPSKDQRNVQALPGTGLCFGSSIPVTSLVELAQKTKDNFEKDELAKSLAAQLRVDVKQLRECLHNSWYSDTQLTVDNCLEYFPTDAVLVESGFALTANDQKFNLAPNTNVVGNLLNQDAITLQDGLPNILDEIRANQQTIKAQSIRVRFRIADLRSNTSTLFKLGIPGSKIGITLRKVEEAGAEGVVDLYTHWFGKDRLKFNERPVGRASSSTVPSSDNSSALTPTPPAEPKGFRTTGRSTKLKERSSPSNQSDLHVADAYKGAVPPVILLHQ